MCMTGRHMRLQCTLTTQIQRTTAISIRLTIFDWKPSLDHKVSFEKGDFTKMPNIMAVDHFKTVVPVI